MRQIPRRIGRFLIRLSDSLFSAPQSDLEKNQNAVRKGLARNAQIRGVFGSPPWAEDFFGNARTSEWPVWAQNVAKNGTHTADTLCLQ
jgi:hypothetical protein